MNDYNLLQQTFDNFNKATASLKDAYANLEEKFAGINRELAIKNAELEKTIAEKDEIKNHLQNILESLTNGVVVTDLAGRIETINSCAAVLTSVTKEGVQGRHVRVLFPDFLSTRGAEKKFSEYFSGEAGHKLKLKGRTLEIFNSPLHARNGEAIGHIFILRDITRIEKLEEMAKRTEKFTAMGEMAANIAHEIRNPLGSIELFASLLMKELPERKDRERAAKIVTSVKNMDNKISNLLLFTKVELSQRHCVNIHDVLKDTLLFAEQLAAQGNILLELAFAAEEPCVLGDDEMLKQVFLNLILNAFQAMPDGGTLQIETSNAAAGQIGGKGTPFLEIMFIDDGIGISENNLPKIFDPFFSTREDTSGLGLAIVHNIMDMHNGVIHVERGVQVGTVFTILLPLWDNKEQSSQISRMK